MNRVKLSVSAVLALCLMTAACASKGQSARVPASSTGTLPGATTAVPVSSAAPQSGGSVSPTRTGSGQPPLPNSSTPRPAFDDGFDVYRAEWQFRPLFWFRDCPGGGLRHYFPKQARPSDTPPERRSVAQYCDGKLAWDPNQFYPWLQAGGVALTANYEAQAPQRKLDQGKDITFRGRPAKVTEGYRNLPPNADPSWQIESNVDGREIFWRVSAGSWMATWMVKTDPYAYSLEQALSMGDLMGELDT